MVKLLLTIYKNCFKNVYGLLKLKNKTKKKTLCTYIQIYSFYSSDSFLPTL